METKLSLKKRLMMLLEMKPMKMFILVTATVIIISVGAIGIPASALTSESPRTIDFVKTKQAKLNANDPKKEEVYTDSI
ncbi:hypothetical protein [Sporosarcina newyorkensis]|uniref:hypothetical protein n=1 Tax=Sporosarcina newyorkensis TaxID=759851 RepID=UPI00117FEB64|nr:hypothetical protein [Sporosarcina newyorkensis]